MGFKIERQLLAACHQVSSNMTVFGKSKYQYFFMKRWSKTNFKTAFTIVLQMLLQDVIPLEGIFFICLFFKAINVCC
jgi:hypothetical protein